MPIQVYHCSKCNTDLEVQVSMKDKVQETIPCPNGPHVCYWRASSVNFIVKDGTGAAKTPR